MVKSLKEMASQELVKQIVQSVKNSKTKEEDDNLGIENLQGYHNTTDILKDVIFLLRDENRNKDKDIKRLLKHYDKVEKECQNKLKQSDKYIDDFTIFLKNILSNCLKERKKLPILLDKLIDQLRKKYPEIFHTKVDAAKFDEMLIYYRQNYYELEPFSEKI